MYTLLETIADNTAGNTNLLNLMEDAYSSWIGLYTGLSSSVTGLIDLDTLTGLLGSLGGSELDSDTLKDLDISKLHLSDLSDRLGIIEKVPGLDADTLTKFMANPTLLGQLLGYALEALCIDENPDKEQDNFYTHVYQVKSEEEKAEPTTESTTVVESTTAAPETTTTAAATENTTEAVTTTQPTTTQAANIPGNSNPKTGTIEFTQNNDEVTMPYQQIIIILAACAFAIVVTILIKKKNESEA